MKERLRAISYNKLPDTDLVAVQNMSNSTKKRCLFSKQWNAKLACTFSNRRLTFWPEKMFRHNVNTAMLSHCKNAGIFV